MRKTQPLKEALTLMLGILAVTLLLAPLSVANAQDQAAPQEDIVESFGAIVDEVEQDLREGRTNAEAGRNFLEVILDFFRSIAPGAYSESTTSSSVDAYAKVTIITEICWIDEDGSEAVAVLNNGTLVETNQSGLE